MKKEEETNWLIFIIFLTGFAFGFILAQAIYDKRPTSEEDYKESQKTEWYE